MGKSKFSSALSEGSSSPCEGYHSICAPWVLGRLKDVASSRMHQDHGGSASEGQNQRCWFSVELLGGNFAIWGGTASWNAARSPWKRRCWWRQETTGWVAGRRKLMGWPEALLAHHDKVRAGCGTGGRTEQSLIIMSSAIGWTASMVPAVWSADLQYSRRRWGSLVRMRVTCHVSPSAAQGDLGTLAY